jgi:hypothetical protein
MSFSDLVGRTLTEAKRVRVRDRIRGRGDSESLRFTDTVGRVYSMYHSQDCCESVYIETLDGNLDDLVGVPILYAYADTNDTSDIPASMLIDKVQAVEEILAPRPAQPNHSESNTWTFYRIGTVKGAVFIRWHGSSSGYYSESVAFDCNEP